MTVRLTVRRADWLQHVYGTAGAYGSTMVPVVKGNGYGFGRPILHDLARDVSGDVCVGSIHELIDVPAALSPVVLTPALRPPSDTWPVLTVGHVDHVRALAGWNGRVMVKLASSMRRYGVGPDELRPLLDTVAAAGLTCSGFALHLPLAGDDDARLAEIEAWFPHLPNESALWVSHLAPAAYTSLRERHPDRDLRIRIGTALWHGRPRGTFLHLSAEVLDVRTIRAGERAGYRLTPAPHGGALVVIGAGSTHGIAPLEHDDPTQRSPFHFAHRRLTLLEPPHMHSSLAIADASAAVPAVGSRVDVQHPLVHTHVDEVEWV
ncbi:MAG: hypothetical protein F2681_13720 [Actinobacteria bacterium]|jgi:alanine racemase|uniref:Unannotated protein n=1 Tax=freshwater metagenome TaxID=449393 RepID=A0A6J6A9Z4_9ZZZZ|nr:hypothetical protein [Actinomycetota bacterium]MSW78369.1 hypothetical protein [Actinomycetota bacterium]MSX56305.1 hypothetical protein [Actinomycetota bacterium]MSX93812.1 hypothetical protein [Actinomycetota bacterium]MSZ84193.1 hypothetical protein [Actinomycetota bacterium]